MDVLWGRSLSNAKYGSNASFADTSILVAHTEKLVAPPVQFKRLRHKRQVDNTSDNTPCLLKYTWEIAEHRKYILYAK